MAEEKGEKGLFTEKDAISLSSTLFGIFFGVHVSQLFVVILDPEILFRPWVMRQLSGFSSFQWVKALFCFCLGLIAVALIYWASSGLLPGGQPRQTFVIVKRTIRRIAILYGTYCAFLIIFIDRTIVLSVYGVLILVGWLIIFWKITRVYAELKKESREKMGP